MHELKRIYLGLFLVFLFVCLGPVWTANFDDIPMDTGTSTASNSNPSNPAPSSPSTSPDTAWSSSPAANSNSETGWADFSNFTPVR